MAARRALPPRAPSHEASPKKPTRERFCWRMKEILEAFKQPPEQEESDQLGAGNAKDGWKEE